MSDDYLTAPVDEAAADRFAADGLRFALVDDGDAESFTAWSQAVARGFLQQRETPERTKQQQVYFSDRRKTGVWDETAADAATPVATVASWPTPLTVPGRSSALAWAISDVSVAATHRRRGIATGLLESELRTAQRLGCSVAVLTVSESTIYGRFGFAPAALARDLTIETRRARWIGPTPDGRVQLVTREQLLVDGPEILERVRLATPGQIAYGGVLWERQLGMVADDETASALRFVRYDDGEGRRQGFAIYRLVANPSDNTKHELVLAALVAATDDAYAGLWRYLLEHDLVSSITAGLRPLDEPLRWMIADFRAVRTSDVDHLWTRILDVPAALEARRFARAGSLVFSIEDRLGFAAGTWSLVVDEQGRATVSAAEGREPQVSMTVNELGALYLGGVSATVLAAAGRITGDAAAVDALFASPVAPWLSIWF